MNFMEETGLKETIGITFTKRQNFSHRQSRNNLKDTKVWLERLGIEESCEIKAKTTEASF